MNELLIYLLEASLYLAVFALAYHLLFAGLTHFQWMRLYLISGVGLSVCLPLLPVPTFLYVWLAEEATGPSNSLPFSWQAWSPPSSVTTSVSAESTVNWLSTLRWGLLTIYGLGVMCQSWRLGLRLRTIYRVIAQHPRKKEGNCWFVTLPDGEPTFSFLHYVFLPADTAKLTADELRQVKAHEAVHIRQWHTYDRLFFELVGIIFWFNPVIYYLKNQLQEVQEYLADQKVGGSPKKRREYAHLLLKLSTPERSFSLATGFSDRQITRRILRLSQPRSSPQQKLTFVSVVPAIAALFFLSACLEEPGQHENYDSQGDTKFNTTSQEGTKIGQITWQGNTLYDDKTLTNILGVQPGDRYDSVTLSQHINFSFANPDQPDISSLYMDRGYLFFNVEVQRYEREEGIVDLTMEIYEGDIMKISQLIIQGNGEVPQEKILAQIPIKRGEPFNRAQLIASQRAIAEMGYFDPQQVGINPIPHPEQGTVDIEFILKPHATP